MAAVRRLIPALLAGAFCAAQLGAQEPTGTISGRVVDATTQEPLPSVSVTVVGTRRGALTQNDGAFVIGGVPAGTQTVRASRIGYGASQQAVTVSAGATVTTQFSLQRQAVQLSEVTVSVGYGTQRKEAITGSVATVNGDEANVGATTNATQLVQGRVAGVNVTLNNGEPGAGSQIRIRGGTSISASNDPLYVVDGVPIENTPTEPQGIGIGGAPSSPRNPLNLLNPADIASITVLKDASATAIYGSRGANGVILIETKRGNPNGSVIEYDGYVASSSPSKKLEVLTGDEYRAYVRRQVAAGVLDTSRLRTLGTANTNWEDALTRNALSHNHNLSFSGGSQDTRYRAAINYLDQQGVIIANGLRRYQGRLNGTQNSFNNRLRLGLNLTASHVMNDYLPYERTGGFEGGVFVNMVTFNPTRPVTYRDPVTGKMVYYEVGGGSQSLRNPVALANQVNDQGTTTRILGNASSDFDILSNLTGRLNVGIDRSEGLRDIYFPLSSPAGAQYPGLASQASQDNTSQTIQTLLTYHQNVLTDANVEVVGGYEYNKYNTGGFGAQARGYSTDAFNFYNLGAGGTLVRPYSYREGSALSSFFTRANLSFRDRYFLTGVLRKDGSSRFGENNKWATFPAISASWRISEEPFMNFAPVSDLRIRAGYGVQGNQAVPPYASLPLLGSGGGFNYPFGDAIASGVGPTRNANPDLRWEQTAQSNIALDYGFLENRFSGSLEYYVKNTKDLLLEVSVPPPANVGTRIENIGRVRNAGVELSLDSRLYDRGTFTWSAGLVFSKEKNKVVNLGSRRFIVTGSVSGQGQSNQNAQRILPGQPLGTFYGPVYAGLDANGKQLFRHYSPTGQLLGTTTTPGGDDLRIIGNANPDWTAGLRSQASWRNFDAGFLIRASVGNDVFNNTALVYATQSNALQDKNFLRSALNDRTGIREPAIYSSRWIEDGSFVRLQNVTVGYSFDLPSFFRSSGPNGAASKTRIYVSGDNLFTSTDYTGYDPEVNTDAGLATRGIDYLNYPRPRTITGGVRVSF
ncbi:MAG TPA: SusC/RagA family TonB-linked outer membrane protein [Gemmatimonadaceae bacterium]|nr:SusC/RagA family TonB-linked outer membrane protein [Gemmatimonadaceae bacterium]